MFAYTNTDTDANIWRNYFNLVVYAGSFCSKCPSHFELEKQLLIFDHSRTSPKDIPANCGYVINRYYGIVYCIVQSPKRPDVVLLPNSPSSFSLTCFSDVGLFSVFDFLPVIDFTFAFSISTRDPLPFDRPLFDTSVALPAGDWLIWTSGSLDIPGVLSSADGNASIAVVTVPAMSL